MVELEGQSRAGQVTVMRLAGIAVSLLVLTSPPVSWDLDSQDFLTSLERDIVQEHNLARTDPETYAGFLEQLKQYFDDELFTLPDRRVRVTREGVEAVDEAIRFLRGGEPVAPVSASRGMSLGARDLVRDQGPSGDTGHRGSDGSQPWDRVSRYGEWEGAIAENVAYGYDKARDVLMQLIIDDGVKDRGHRNNIFNPAFRVVGVSCGAHVRYETICVITYASGYAEGQ